MRALSCVLVALLATACGGGSERPRVLVVGWDGASYRMIDKLAREGRLPNAARLISRGSSTTLESTVVPISSAAWTAAVTGKGPAETGVYGFFEPIEGSYDIRLISARSNRATPLWRTLTMQGRRSIVFGVPITYPPEPILGTLVAGMLSPFRGTYTWPPELTDELRQRHFEPDLDVWKEARGVGWDHFWKQLDIKRDVLVEMLAEDDWDFAMIVFKSLDVASHLAYEADFEPHVAPIYERLDEILGELLDVVGSDVDVLLASDHGFTVYRHGFNLHAWLLERGHAVRKDHVLGFTIDERAPLEWRGRQIVMQARNELDWSKSVAFRRHLRGELRFDPAERRRPRGRGLARAGTHRRGARSHRGRPACHPRSRRRAAGCRGLPRRGAVPPVPTAGWYRICCSRRSEPPRSSRTPRSTASWAPTARPCPTTSAPAC